MSVELIPIPANHPGNPARFEPFAFQGVSYAVFCPVCGTRHISRKGMSGKCRKCDAPLQLPH